MLAILLQVLDIVEQRNESSEEIYELLKSCVNSCELTLENIFSYAAENATVNYGAN